MFSAEEFYRECLGLQEDELMKKLLPITNIICLKKYETVIREGEKQTVVPFLLRGIARGYYTGINGQEITDCLQIRYGAPLTALPFDRPSPITIEVLTESYILQFPTAALEGLMQNPSVIKIYNQLLQKSMVDHWTIKNVLCQHDAMERYEWFLQEYPDLIDEINNKYVASFLKMTPVTLSRLRRSRGETPKGEKEALKN